MKNYLMCVFVTLVMGGFQAQAESSDTQRLVESELELFPGQGKQTVKLPFPYATLSKAEKENLVFVQERFYAVLEDGEASRCALVGPLKPCIFVGLRNEANGRTVIFHKHYSNSIYSLLDILKKELDMKDPKQIRGKIFTNTKPLYNEESGGSDWPGWRTWQEAHQGRSQLAEMEETRDWIWAGLNISDASQIDIQECTTPYQDYELGAYEYAELFVVVNSRLEIRNICPMGEELFTPGLKRLSIGDRRHVTSQDIKSLLLQKTQESFGVFTPETLQNLHIYGAVPFVKL